MATFILGMCAGALCTISFVPQVIKIIKTRNTRDLSLLTFSVFALGVFLWFVYGLIIKQVPVIFTNAVMFVLALIIVGMKLKHG